MRICECFFLLKVEVLDSSLPMGICLLRIYPPFKVSPEKRGVREDGEKHPPSFVL